MSCITSPPKELFSGEKTQANTKSDQFQGTQDLRHGIPGCKIDHQMPGLVHVREVNIKFHVRGLRLRQEQREHIVDVPGDAEWEERRQLSSVNTQICVKTEKINDR